MLKRAAMALLICMMTTALWAQDAPTNDDASAATTLFPHSETSRWQAYGQINTIYQAHTEFHSSYAGANSLRAGGEAKDSRVMTLYLGARLSPHFETLVDVESSGGRGIGEALGVAGFTNLDVVRNPSLGSAPYLARLIAHGVWGLGAEKVKVERGPMNSFYELPARRFELRAGKMSVVDFFDVNAEGSDSHLQFMNWTVDNNGAYDYAADARGYTWGAIAEYQQKSWGLRFGEMLMPTVANGEHLDWALRRAHAENYELELRPEWWRGHTTFVRALAYRNTANMGDYRAAVARYESHLDARPTIENTRAQGTAKYGFGLGVEQPLTKDLKFFGRLGWNEGRHESFAYTEVNATAEIGAGLVGAKWRRANDKTGVAFVSNGISRDHQQYLRRGGMGFLLGDGALTYGRENIVEWYYTAHLWRGFFGSFDLQRITNPGYNRDRGPVLAPSVRLHLDL